MRILLIISIPNFQHSVTKIVSVDKISICRDANNLSTVRGASTAKISTNIDDSKTILYSTYV